MAATSRPDQLDYTFLGLHLLVIFILGVYVIVPTKIRPEWNPDFSSRLRWLTIIVNGCFTLLITVSIALLSYLVYIPFPIDKDLIRPPARLSDTSFNDYL